MARSNKPPIHGPLEGTFRAGRKPKSAIYEDVVRAGVSVRIRYPGTFDVDKILAAAPLAQSAAEMAIQIRDRWVEEDRAADGGRSQGAPGHNMSGGMWKSMVVQILKQGCRVTFVGTSDGFRETFERRSPFIVDGYWAKRNGGPFAPALPGEIEYVSTGIEPTGRAVKNQIKARSASKWGSILQYTQPEALAFADNVRVRLQQRLEKELS
jgi:hypothetical protein